MNSENAPMNEFGPLRVRFSNLSFLLSRIDGTSISVYRILPIAAANRTL